MSFYPGSFYLPRAIYGHRVDLNAKKPRVKPPKKLPCTCKMTDEQVRAARKAYEAVGAAHRTCASLAAEYKMTLQGMYSILRYINRTNVK